MDEYDNELLREQRCKDLGWHAAYRAVDRLERLLDRRGTYFYHLRDFMNVARASGLRRGGRAFRKMAVLCDMVWDEDKRELVDKSQYRPGSLTD